MKRFPDENTLDAQDGVSPEGDISPAEAARLANLQSYQILDTLPEQAYDDLTQLASIICGAPIALISLLDDHRQWFKSKIGIDLEETPLELSFCRHAIASPQETMIVPDATQDERFDDHPFVVGQPDIRFYAGAPLVTSAGHALGTLCVVDFMPRDLTETQREALQALARQVIAQLELRRALMQANLQKTALEEAHAKAQALAMEVQDLYDHAPVGYHSLDADGMIQRINQTELRWLGYTCEEVIGKLHLTDILAPAYRPGFAANYEKFKQSGEMSAIELELQRKDGTTFFCYLSASAVCDPNGNFLNTRSSVSDISELRRATQSLRESEKRFKAFMEHGPGVSFIKDENGYYLYANPLMLRRFDKTWGEFVGHRDSELWPSAIHERAHRSDLAVLEQDKPIATEETVPMPDGSTAVWLSFKFPLHNSEGPRLLGGIGVDITERKEYEQKLEEYQQQLENAVARLEKLAVTDLLTGLKNHGAFMERLKEEVTRARRYDLPLSLVLLDADYFKSYNDTFGHPAGDEVLRRLGALLRTHARPSDFSARYGGEEFAVILGNTALEGALVHAERIRHAVETAEWVERPVTVSGGVAHLVPSMPDAAALLAAADAALYKAKHAGRNCIAH